MGSYGIRISRDGIDAKTGADKDMVVTSKYSLLKGAVVVSGTKSVPDNPTGTTETIAHGLGYIPMVSGFWNDRDGDYSDPTYWYPMPFYLVSGVTVQFTISADATNVYLTFIIDAGGAANIDINYKYYIFIDKGKIT